jgi:hypothetical protein
MKSPIDIDRWRGVDIIYKTLNFLVGIFLKGDRTSHYMRSSIVAMNTTTSPLINPPLSPSAKDKDISRVVIMESQASKYIVTSPNAVDKDLTVVGPMGSKVQKVYTMPLATWPLLIYTFRRVKCTEI